MTILHQHCSEIYDLMSKLSETGLYISTLELERQLKLPINSLRDLPRLAGACLDLQMVGSTKKKWRLKQGCLYSEFLDALGSGVRTRKVSAEELRVALADADKGIKMLSAGELEREYFAPLASKLDIIVSFLLG
jgi:hypothetical protein